MNLKSFREDKLKIKTQSEFAELIGVDQSSISRWERDPDGIPYQVIQKILEKTGASYEELTGWTKPIPEPLDVEDTWEKTDFTKCTLIDYISKALDQIKLTKEQRKMYLDDLRAGVDASVVKPKMAIVGRSDTGKSTLINAFLGSDKMPVAWTPTTSIAVYIKHISDRPSFMEEEAWVFASHHGEEDMWNERRLADEAYCRKWKIAAGGVEILRSFGTRQGEHYEKQAGAAVVFLDAPILRSCDIVDLPGFGTETESDDNITFAAAQKADVIIYLSQANGFMRIEDIIYLKRNIAQLPVWEHKGDNELGPLSNLFVVASQAHTVNNGNRAELSEILDVGCRNLLKTLPKEYWSEREAASGYAYSEGGWAALRARFFTYTVDIPDLGKALNDSLAKLLEMLPGVIETRVKDFVRGYVASRKPNLTGEIEKYEGIIAQRDSYAALLKQIEENEVGRIRDNDARKQEVRDVIKRLRWESVEEYNAYLASTVNVDALVKSMRERGVKNKREDVELFSSALQSDMQSRCESILKVKSRSLAQTTKDYITAYSEGVEQPFAGTGIHADFDVGWAFASALAGLGMLGGLGMVLAAVVPDVLFLVGMGVTLGTSIWIVGLGFTSLGPIGVALGLLFAGGLGVARLVSGGWERSVAKKIVSAFEEHDFRLKFGQAIQEYWDQTEAAFNKASAKLDQDWDAYVDDLRQMLDDYDVDGIQNRIAALRCLSDFFDNIPL